MTTEYRYYCAACDHVEYTTILEAEHHCPWCTRISERIESAGTDAGCAPAPGSAFLQYLLKRAETKAAMSAYNHAAAALDNAQIRERLAEIESQYEPLDSLMRKPLSERDRLCAAAFYVVVGRLPNSPGERPTERTNHEEEGQK